MGLGGLDVREKNKKIGVVERYIGSGRAESQVNTNFFIIKKG